MNAQPLSRGDIKLSASCFPSSDNNLGHTKRYAMYIPQSFFDNARRALAQIETESTWEFSPALITSSESVLPESTSGLSNTPAQEIAFRYRAGMPLCFDEDAPQSDVVIDIGASTDDGSSTTFYSPVECPECPSDDTLTVTISQTEIKFPHRQTCPEFSETLEKAVHSATQTRGFREDNIKTCPSTKLLRTMVNRMFQLHTHDVQEGRRMLWLPSPKLHENREDLQGSLQHSFRSIIVDILSKFSRHR